MLIRMLGLLAIALTTKAGAADLEVSLALSPNPRTDPSSWIVCESFVASGRDGQDCVAIPIGPSGVSVQESITLMIVKGSTEDEPPFMSIVRPGDTACKDSYEKLRRAFGRPVTAVGSPTHSPAVEVAQVEWKASVLRIKLDCLIQPARASITMIGAGDEKLASSVGERYGREIAYAKLRLANDSILDSIDVIAERIGTVAAKSSVELCALAGNSYCARDKLTYLAEWSGGQKAHDISAVAVDPAIPNSIPADEPSVDAVVLQPPEAQPVAQPMPSRDATHTSDTRFESALSKEPTETNRLMVAPSQSSKVDVASCQPRTRFNSGVRVVTVGCGLTFVVRRGNTSGSYVDVIVEAANESDRDQTIDPRLIVARSGQVLSFDEVVSRIKRGALGETFGRFLAGAVEVWGASRSSSTSVSSGRVSGFVDGEYVSGRYTATTTDSSEGRRRADAAISRADRDFDEIERSGERRISDAEEQYLRPHTLAPGERVVRFVTVRLPKRARADELLQVMIATPSGDHWIDL